MARNPRTPPQQPPEPAGVAGAEGAVDPIPGGDADHITPDDLALSTSASPDSGGAISLAAPVAAAIRIVIARDGLKLRAGPGIEFPAIRTLTLGTRVHILKQDGAWTLIDQEGDGAADGYVFGSFLRDEQRDAATPNRSSAARTGSFVPLDKSILQGIMDGCGGIPIRSKLDLDVVADALNRAMLLADANTRLREVAFLSQSVIETDYFRTFSEYGKGQGKAYAPYYGRGMHQLTWEATYAACSRSIFGDNRLVTTPDLILSDIEVNIKATAWYWRDYKPFNALADAADIDEIIHRLYGGQITSPNAAVRRSVILRRSFYVTIGRILDKVG